MAYWRFILTQENNDGTVNKILLNQTHLQNIDQHLPFVSVIPNGSDMSCALLSDAHVLQLWDAAGKSAMGLWFCHSLIKCDQFFVSASNNTLHGNIFQGYYSHLVWLEFLCLCVMTFTTVHQLKCAVLKGQRRGHGEML